MAATSMKVRWSSFVDHFIDAMMFGGHKCSGCKDREVGMAHWKRLTGTDGDQIDVNMDVVAYLHPLKDHTAVCFVSGRSAEGRAMVVSVKERPDAIHSATPLRSS